ncbi:uncharacterized protein BJ171DRAFT_491330 [Polychytrium aggregatum]|uniref:uncharacterized protein n=1 Tax=Polychytrium aggregatum TaxID=110093 RepID=UPI0022FF4131|nr:uncharacterized protein BJ171DRAFT_518617 [Polychytrium aggregatum]XP_052969815.1 uncharacterized protein BJ171DRAFT_491330 [Polychytrium aggregatum]KAI9199520.1 hypothetical protein BJ171DRAFT_518617 [Polychytrium aggregatum]KAI9207735.1 hypothetical protein BJ171DRAFT_491330 [Polychytrium aggregatum]
MHGPQPSRRVLSIQSHVVYGYVGNKASTFPLQLLGFDVDPINTVQFSNHTGYPAFTGQRIDGDQLESLFDGLEKNGMLNDYSNVITGYIGRKNTLEVTQRFIEKLKRKHPSVQYVLDPVMGDEGRLYVSEELIPIYKQMCRLADIVTPNSFEAEILSDVKVDCTTSAIEACRKINDMGARIVIITSAQLGDQDNPSETLHLVAYLRLEDQARAKAFLISFPKLQGYFTGTGDMFASLLLAHIHMAQSRHQGSLQTARWLEEACELAVATMNQVLMETSKLSAEASTGSSGEPVDGPGTTLLIRRRELRLIQSKKHIEAPHVLFKARDLEL